MSPAPSTRPAPPPAVHRRRRGVAALLLLATLLLAVGATHSSGGPARARSAARHAARRAPAPGGSAPTPAQRAAHARAAEAAAVARVLAYAPVIRSGGARGHEVALTFDDGPGPYTTRLVQALNSLHVHATFFAIGMEERWFSAGTDLELRSGDVVGDHTETHPQLVLLSRHAQREQIFEALLRIQLQGGPTPHLFRPPYGSFDPTTLRVLRSLHMLTVLWSVDYTLPGAAAIAERALAGARPGAIILLHDGGGDRSQTIAALPAIVRGLRRRGLEPVTIPRLLLDDPPPHGLPVPTSLAGD